MLSELPLTTSRSLYCRHAIPRLCPFRVLTNSHVEVFHTLMVRSPEAETIYFSSKSTTFTAARCPTSTRRNVISVCDVISHTAIDRSCNIIWFSISPSTSASAKNILVQKQTPPFKMIYTWDRSLFFPDTVVCVTFAVHTWNYVSTPCVLSMSYCKPLYQLINPNPLHQKNTLVHEYHDVEKTKHHKRLLTKNMQSDRWTFKTWVFHRVQWSLNSGIKGLK